MTNADLSPAAAALRSIGEQAQSAQAAPAQQSISNEALDAILGRKDDGDAFNSLLEAARTQLGVANWRDTTGQKDEGLVIEASAPVIANELSAVIEHADKQIKYWSAQKEAAREVIKDAITAAAADRFPDEATAPKNITFKAHNVTVATFNRTADSRVLDSAQVKAMFPDTPDHAQLWKTQPGSRRLLLK